MNVDDPSGAAFATRGTRERRARDPRVARRARRRRGAPALGRGRRTTARACALALPEGELAVALPLLGDFNLENLLVAVGIGSALGRRARADRRGRRGVPPGAGPDRARAATADGPRVIVDYAHTPDAVEKLLATLRPLCRGRLIAVFGCGGDRDRTQAPADGGGRGALRRPRRAHERQSAHRGPREDPRRRRARPRAGSRASAPRRSTPARATRGSPTGAPRSPRRSRSRRPRTRS